MKYNKIFIAILGLAAIISCSKEVEQNAQVCFEPELADYVSEAVSTKATLVTPARFKDACPSFYVTAYENGAVVADKYVATYQTAGRFSGKWAFPASQSLMVAKGSTKAYFCWGPTDMFGSGNAIAHPTLTYGSIISKFAFNYTLPTDLSAQKEFFFGFAEDYSAATSGKVSPKFIHPLASVQVYVKTVSPSSLTLTELKFLGANSKGDFQVVTLMGPQQKLMLNTLCTSSVPADYVLSKNVTLSNGAAIAAGSDSFLMIPQTFDASSTAKIVFTVKDSAGVSHEFFIPLAGETWKAGHTTKYQLTINL